MIVYAHRSYALEVVPFLHRFEQRVRTLPESPPHDSITSLLVDFGEIESAVADALLPTREEERPELRAWQSASRAVADLFCASAARDRVRVHAAAAALPPLIGALSRSTPPSSVRRRIAEGFSCYRLYPEQYIDAAQQLLASLRPAAVLCIGLRSIGSILAAVVASALSAHGVRVASRSVRPRGHPYERTVVADRSFTEVVSEFAAHVVVIVDEGPGLSGSSFAAAAEMALAAGVPTNHIVLMPAWDAPADGLRSQRARDVWTKTLRVVGTFVPPNGLSMAGRDLSAGAWRPLIFGGDHNCWPAVQPQHERVKILGDAAAPPVVSRFAGLGRYGEAKLMRATELAEAGFGPTPRSLTSGFLVLDWVVGPPARHVASLAPRVADYLAFVRRTFALPGGDDVGEVGEMMSANAAEALGDGCPDALAALVRSATRFSEPQVAIDGRLLPHEWIDRGDCIVKVDALDHHADDFFPGCRDVAWDVAGALVELEFPPELADLLVARYQRLSGDATLGHRLPFYTAAYLAYRVGYASLACEALGETDDGIRFKALRSRYRRSLAALLGCRDPPGRR